MISRKHSLESKLKDITRKYIKICQKETTYLTSNEPIPVKEYNLVGVTAIT